MDVLPIQRAHRATPSERYLKNLCNKSFLSLWSYPGVYRDQGRRGQPGDGKEVCDLVVVFENHMIIFSDKECGFPNTGDLHLDWCRWFRRAVQQSAEQIWGAERWIRSNPHRLFLDRGCTQPFPIEVPAYGSANIHRIVVAHAASKRCREELGGSGSLMIATNVIGDMHYADVQHGGTPFAIGQLDPSKGFVHVFDDTSLGIVMTTLDTITDFVAYLSKKEKLIGTGRHLWAAGEEELLALYLKDINETGEHDFVLPSDWRAVAVDEGLWDRFVHSPERQAQLSADRVSYAWDGLIETFNKYILAGDQYYAAPAGIRDQERLMRLLAREPRLRRRMLAEALLQLIEKTPRSLRATRLLFPSNPGDPFYVFLLLPLRHDIPLHQYREVRLKLLYAYCMVTKLKYPGAEEIVGIATETGTDRWRSQDAIYYDARSWTPAEEAEAKGIHAELGLLRDARMTFKGTWREYPCP